MDINSNNHLEASVFSNINLSQRRTEEITYNKSARRIVIIDILRGFALFGVLLVHLVFSFSGWSFLSEERAIALPFSQFDIFVSEFVKFFFSHKFRGIFSFLFGLSFSIQMVSSIEKGLPYKKIFYKRMAVLSLFGIIHSYLFWHGDVLRWYVIAGLVLLWIHKWKSRKLLIAGIFLSTIIPILNNIIKKISGDISSNIVSSDSFLQVLTGNSISDLLYTNFLWDFDNNVNPFYRISFVLVILGQFMLGFWAGRNNIFKKHEYYKPVFKKLLWVGLTIGLGGTGMVFFVKYFTSETHFYLPFIIKLGMEVPESFGIMGLALSYICGLTVLHDQPFWRNKLALFIPVGRMALTNYIMQTLICITIFYGIGFGFIGKLSLIYMLPICVLIYGFQILFSKIWLDNFHSGPLEWVWRSLMKGKKQPLLKVKSKITPQPSL